MYIGTNVGTASPFQTGISSSGCGQQMGGRLFAGSRMSMAFVPPAGLSHFRALRQPAMAGSNAGSFASHAGAGRGVTAPLLASNAGSGSRPPLSSFTDGDEPSASSFFALTDVNGVGGQSNFLLSEPRPLHSNTVPRRGSVQMQASKTPKEPEPPLPIEQNIKFLEDLRKTPIKERYEQLGAMPAEMRRRLFEAGETGNELVGKLLEQFDWSHFTLDAPGIAGLYPYALLSKTPYLCVLDDAAFATLSAGYAKLADAGFVVHSVHEEAEIDESTCNRLLLFERGSELVISIRGTQSDRDWDINFDFLPDSDAACGLEGRFHKGYLRIFKELRALVEPELQRIREKNGVDKLSIGLVGHSMGAALSLMFAQWLECSDEYEVKRVVTLGGVRGYGGDAVKAFEALGLAEKTTRVINFVDVVPLGWPNLSHPKSDRLFLTINGKYWLNPSSVSMLFNQWQRFTGEESRGYGGDTRETSDHDVINYIKILSAHALDDTMAFDETAGQGDSNE